MLDNLNSSVRIGRVLGSEIRLHVIFLAFAAIMVGSVFLRAGTSGAIWEALTMTAVFGSVLLHEFGHAMAARALGIATPTITLYPFGGIAFLDRAPRAGLAELFVAFAGPLVSALIAIGLAAAGYWKEGEVEPNTIEGFLEFLIFANMGLAIFNMIPAFPMDGGRILKALMAIVIPERVALLIAVALGQIIAVGMICGAIYIGAPMFAVVGAFVFLASAAEAGRHPLWLLGLGRKPATSADS